MKDVKVSHPSPGLSPKSRLFNAVVQGECVRAEEPSPAVPGWDGGEVGWRRGG